MGSGLFCIVFGGDPVVVLAPVWLHIGLLAKNETVYANEAHISGGVPLASIDASSDGAEMQYFDSDYLGTTTAVYSASGEVDVRLASSFGAGTESDELRFTGKPYDADLDAHVFPYRNYKAEVGNWASADPAGFPDGPNQHYYAAVPTMGLDPLGLAIVFSNNVSQTTRDAFSNVSSSDYGQNCDSSFSRVSESNQGIFVTEGDANNYSSTTNILTINPDESVMITVEPGGVPTNGLASLESIIIHETQHAFDDFFNSEDYSDFSDTPGTMGASVLEDRAMDEANAYRLLAGEYLRIWYNDLNDYLEQ